MLEKLGGESTIIPLPRGNYDYYFWHISLQHSCMYVFLTLSSTIKNNLESFPLSLKTLFKTPQNVTLFDYAKLKFPSRLIFGLFNFMLI